VKTLKDLVLALLNATLILVALCLVLALMVLGRMNDFGTALAGQMTQARPLVAELSATRDELAGLRQDVAALREDADGSVRNELDDRLARLDARLNMVAGRMDGMALDPAQIRQQAVEATAQAVGLAISRIQGCAPPGA